MKLYQVIFIVAAVLVLASVQVDAKRKKQRHHEDSRKTKTKTKWSTTTDLGSATADSMVSAEEHGYYVKRTFLPINSRVQKLQSPPYLGIPIAWFSCNGEACQHGNSGAINGNSNALSDGFLCDDDCEEPYEPICGKTASEVAVFYNKCKLNVAKCRTHGLWIDLPYEECQKTYPKETEYTDKKFKSCPFFKDKNTKPEEIGENAEPVKDSKEQEQLPALPYNTADQQKPGQQQNDDKHLKTGLTMLDEISSKLSEVEQAANLAHNKEKKAAPVLPALKSENETNKLKYNVSH